MLDNDTTIPTLASVYATMLTAAEQRYPGESIVKPTAMLMALDLAVHAAKQGGLADKPLHDALCALREVHQYRNWMANRPEDFAERAGDAGETLVSCAVTLAHELTEL